MLRSLAWLRADPVDLSPNGDGVGDSITISFEVRQAGVVAVEIRDRGYPLALVQVGWLEAGSHATQSGAGSFPRARSKRARTASG